MSALPDRLRTVARWIVRIGVGIVILATLVVVVLDLYGRSRIRTAERRYLASGGQLDIEAFLVPIGEREVNASTLLDAIGSGLQVLPETERMPFAWDDLSLAAIATDDNLVSTVRDRLDRPANRLVLELFDEGAGTQSARYLSQPAASATLAARYADYTGKRIPALHFTRALRARAYLAAYDNHPDAAYRDIASILRISSWMSQECPAITPWLLATAVAQIGLEGLEQLMWEHAPSEENRAAIRAELDRLDEYTDTGLASEFAYVYYLTRTAKSFGTPPPARGIGSRISDVAVQSIEKLWTAGYLELFPELIEYSNIPPIERPQELEFLRRGPFYRKLAQITLPNLLDSVSKADAHRVRLELARLALASSDLPASEERLRGALPIDPFTGTPMRWGGDDGCTLYSVGVNGNDDGGVGRTAGQRNEEDDLAWRLPCRARVVLEDIPAPS